MIQPLHNYQLPPKVTLASDGSLMFDGFRCDQLVRRKRTPLYVYSAEQIRCNYRAMADAFDAHLSAAWRIFYAYKGNPSPAICQLLHNEGAGAEVVSEGELRQALTAVSGDSVVFNNVAKTRSELTLALEKNVHLVIVDSETELDILNELATDFNRKVQIGIRVRPGITAGFHKHVQTADASTKFGFSAEAVARILPRIKKSKGLALRAIHVHLGSQVCDVEKYEQSAVFAFNLLKRLREDFKFPIDIVDLGGGMAIQDEHGHRLQFDFVSLAKRLTLALRSVVGADQSNWPTLYFEPNRALVGNAGILLGRVASLKRDVGRFFVGTDVGFSALVRPMLYGAYHEIKSVSKPFADAAEPCEIVGPLCETGDVLGRNVPLAQPQVGDLIAVFDAGAYGFAQSSSYNSLPRPGERLIDGGVDYEIRKPESYRDLNRLAVIPRHLDAAASHIQGPRSDTRAAADSGSGAGSYASAP